MTGLASAARVVHVVLLALGIGAAAQLLMISDTLDGAHLQWGADVRAVVRAQLDSFMILSAPFLLITLAIGWAPLQAQLRTRAVGVGVWAVMGAVSARWLSPQLQGIRSELGRALDGLPGSTPGLADWAQLSTISQTLLFAQLALGVLLLWWAVTATGPKRSYSGIQLVNDRAQRHSHL